jgi:hypothetical protein
MDRGLQAAQKLIKMTFKPYFSVVSGGKAEK